MCGSQFPNELITFAIVQIIIDKGHVEIRSAQFSTRVRQTGHNGYGVRRKKLAAGVGCKNGVVFDIQNSHFSQQRSLRVLMHQVGDGAAVFGAALFHDELVHFGFDGRGILAGVTGGAEFVCGQAGRSDHAVQ